MSTKRSHDEGFTLMEVMVVMVIIAILVAIALLSYYSATARARTITCEHNQRLFDEAVYIYEAENDLAPTVIGDLEDYMVDYDLAVECPNGDGTLLQYNAASKDVTCPNH